MKNLKPQTLYLLLVALFSFFTASVLLYYENKDLKNDVKNLSEHMLNQHQNEDSLTNIIDSLSHIIND